MNLLLELEEAFGKHRLSELEVTIKKGIDSAFDSERVPSYFGVTVRYDGITYEANASKGEMALGELGKQLAKQKKASSEMHSAFFDFNQ